LITSSVGDQLGGEVVLEDRRIPLKDRAVLGRLDMLVEREDALLLVEAAQLVHQVEQCLIVGGLPFRPLQHLADALERALDDGHRVGDDESAESRAADHHALVGQGVEHDVHVAARQHESTEDQPENHDKSED
jgi:hypothetical protein